MAFRLSVNQASDLTTIGVAGRLGADADQHHRIKYRKLTR